MANQVERNKPQEDKQLFADGERLSRRLGLSEKVLIERERVNHWGTVTSVLLLDSKEELNQDHLRKALSILPRRFPLLRMRINESGSEACFEEMDSPDTVDFGVLHGITADKWEEGFEGEINGAWFNTGTGPLWRVRLLSEAFHEGKFRNALVFTLQHAICDALSIFELQKKLLEFLTFLHSGKKFEVESVPFRPAMESLMSNLIEPSVGERLLFSSYFTLQRVKTFFTKPENLYLSVYPPVANSDPSVAKKTCLLSRNLSEQETRLLIKGCKENKCTVHGAITASTHLAIARILQQKKHDLETPVSVESGYTVSLRKYCQPKVNSDEFGAYVCVSALSVPVPLLYPDDKQGFWEFARACTREVHTHLSSGKHLNVPKLYHCVDIPAYCRVSNYEYNEGRRTQIMTITNCGALKTDQSEESPYKFGGMYFGLRGEKIGHIFGNNILTVDGKLYWAVEYFPHVTTTKQAEEFTDLSLQILKDVCETSE